LPTLLLVCIRRQFSFYDVSKRSLKPDIIQEHAFYSDTRAIDDHTPLNHGANTAPMIAVSQFPV
jgi:hypothetical protein